MKRLRQIDHTLHSPKTTHPAFRVSARRPTIQKHIRAEAVDPVIPLATSPPLPTTASNSSLSNGNSNSNGAKAATLDTPSTSHVNQQLDTSPKTSSSSTLGPLHGAHVSIQQAVKYYNTRQGVFKALNNVSLEVPSGTITALLGPSGSGKTTLLRVIAGLEEPTSGQIFFDDTNVTDTPIQQRDIGVVFQGYALFKHMTVAQNIAFGPRIRKTGVALEAKVEELLKLIEMEEYGRRFPAQLSGGQKQRVALARALACDPRVLLLDEPFGALDPVVRKSLRAGLRDVVKRLGVTTVMVTHDQEEAWDLADNVVILHQGKIQQIGSPTEIAAAPANPFVMNFVSDVAHIPATSQLVRKMGFITDKPLVMLRPSDLTVYTSFSVQPYICPATVVDKYNVGRAIRYNFKFDDGVEIEWYCSRTEEAKYDFSVEQRVYIKADPAKMMEFEMCDIEWSAPDAA